MSSDASTGTAAAAVAVDASATTPSVVAPPLRVYVHSVLNASFRGWPEHTFVALCSGGAASITIRKLKTMFKEELMRKHFSKVSKASKQLQTMNKGTRQAGKESRTNAEDGDSRGSCRRFRTAPTRLYRIPAHANSSFPGACVLLCVRAFMYDACVCV